jgi:rhamnogalacturonyl hydrolase YesR
MDRRSFLCGAALSSAGGALAQGARPAGSKGAEGREQDESRKRIEKAKRAALAMQRRDWEQGILAQALLEVGDREGVILLTRAAMMQATPDGRMGVVVSGGVTDPAMGGAAYAQAAEWTGDAEMKSAVDALLEWIRHKAPRSKDGILYHVFEGPEMWSDGFNGAPPFLAAKGFYDEALEQIEGYRARLWDEKKQLLRHIWDDGEREFKDASCWGGGNGWAAAGLARVIRSLPRERKTDRVRLAEFARAIVDGCLAHQRPDGLFYNVVDDPATFVETNLAQMLAYAVYSGVAEGWLRGSYRGHADRMRMAARVKVDAHGFVQGACGAPEFDRPGVSTEAQAFFVLMESATCS